MIAQGLNYNLMVEGALRGVMRQALAEAAENGLPGNHHFYITFRTNFPGVRMPDYLKARFPTEMTIVLQFQYYDLAVDETAFSVTLLFNNIPEKLVVPLLAITMFADPSVNFALPFQPPEHPAEEPAARVETLKPVEAKTPAKAVTVAPHEPGAAPGEGGDKSGAVVSLDKFRKK